MIYLVVGLDHDTLTPWHRNVQAVDVTVAKQIAIAKAKAQGIRLVVAAVIGPYSSVVSDPARERAVLGKVTFGRRLSSSRLWDLHDAARGEVDVFAGEGTGAPLAERLPGVNAAEGDCAGLD